MLVYQQIVINKRAKARADPSKKPWLLKANFLYAICDEKTFTNIAISNTPISGNKCILNYTF